MTNSPVMHKKAVWYGDCLESPLAVKEHISGASFQPLHVETSALHDNGPLYSGPTSALHSDSLHFDFNEYIMCEFPSPKTIIHTSSELSASHTNARNMIAPPAY